MKFKTTKKEIMRNYSKVIKVGYCALQYTLQYESPAAYTAGVYGWNADIYTFGGVAIVTGSRSFGNCELTGNLAQVYEDRAKAIRANGGGKAEMRALINELINSVTSK